MSSSVVTVRAAGSSTTTVSMLQLYLLRGAYLLLVLAWEAPSGRPCLLTRLGG